MIIDGLVYGLVIKLTSDHFYLAFACLGAIGAILKELVSL